MTLHRLSTALLAVLLLGGCTKDGPSETPGEAAAPAEPAPEAPAATEPAPAEPTPATTIDEGVTPVADPPPGTSVTPAQLYEGCRDRVEGPQTAGECKTDADCAPAGCSREMCVAAASAADIMGTCEILPCFQVLDTCGCHDGQCTWTVKGDAPSGGARIVPTGPPKE